MNALEKAVEVVGSRSAMARAIGVRYQSVQKWIARGYAPAGRVLAIEAATGGQVTRHELRPDIYPEEEGSAAA